MKNLFKVFGIIAFVAVIGFSFTACGGGGLVGKWEDISTPAATITFTTTRFEMKGGDTVAAAGTYELNPSTGTGILHDEIKSLNIPFTLSDGVIIIIPYHFKKIR